MIRASHAGALALASVALLAGSGCGSSSGSSHGTSKAGTATAPVRTNSTASTEPQQASAGTATTVSLATGPVRATMSAGSHHPVSGRLWPVHFTVTDAGAPARASVSYEYLLGEQVVARRSHYTFTG